MLKLWATAATDAELVRRLNEDEPSALRDAQNEFALLLFGVILGFFFWFFLVFGVSGLLTAVGWVTKTQASVCQFLAITAYWLTAQHLMSQRRGRLMPLTDAPRIQKLAQTGYKAPKRNLYYVDYVMHRKGLP